ncbi:MAG: hypothetical protein AAGA54_21105 [Myxococcota bacterium]
MLTESQRHGFARLFVLKLLDLDADDGGLRMPVVLPPELDAFEPVLVQAAVEGLVEIDRKRGEYRLTAAGVELLGVHIDEAEAYIEEFDDVEVAQMLPVLKARRIDPMRVRFLWGWYQGEFDDPVLFQQRRGVPAPEADWAAYILSAAFYAALAEDFA